MDERQEQQQQQDDGERRIPSNDRRIAREGEKNRKAMDSIPPAGTDPLHEGP